MPFIGSSSPNWDQLSAPDILSRVARPKPRFSEAGGLGDKLDNIAAALMDAGGNSEGADSIYQQLRQRQLDERQAEQDELENHQRRAQIQRLSRPEVLNLGDGGVATYDYDRGGLNVVREPTVPDRSSETERLLDRLKTTPAGPDHDLIERVLRGYQYTPEVMQAQQANRLNARQAPTYRDLHPKAGGGAGGVTPNKRADVIAQAQKAIQAGADPAKVRARLAQMGVSM